MIKQYRGADRAINYLFENAKEVSIQRYLTTGTLIATLSIDNVDFELYSAGGDNVAWNQLSISGTKIAQISINGTITDIYAPTAGGATALSGLSDVNLFSPTDGQVLKYDATNQVWVNANESGGSSTLDGLSDVSITTPTNGQVLAYDATSGEWVNSNAGGGGGGEYTRTSLWSGQASSGVEITLLDDVENYDALEFVTKIISNGARNSVIVDAKSFPTKYPYSSSLTMNDPNYLLLGYDNYFGRANIGTTTSKLYIWGFTNNFELSEVHGIKYGGSSGTLIEPVIYSTTEREVGVWTDGKPLYQKTIEIASFPSTVGAFVDYPHNIADIDKICTWEGEIRFSDGMVGMIDVASLANASTINFGGMTHAYVTKTNIRIIVGMDRSTASGEFTIRYTKTTDTPGSGTLTPSGIPTQHYSTDEQIVGTWIGGKTIYQKSVNIGKILSTGTTLYTLGITGVDSIIDYSIIPMQRENSDVYNVDNGDVTWNQGSYFVRYFQNDSSVGLKIAVYSGNYLSEGDIYVTVWYTKTTT